MKTHEGRIAAVTGAARGIGRATCVGFATRGATVCGIDVADMSETASLVADAGGDWLEVITDLSSPDCGTAVAERIEAKLGRCDILINNAGITDGVGWDDLDFDLWRKIFAINLEAPFHLAKTLVPLMRRGGWGRIANLTSASILNPMPRFVSYRASKMGVIGLTRALAAELGDDGITVNAVGPGPTRTHLMTDNNPAGSLENLSRGRPIKRVAEPEDLVGTLLFLSSDDAALVTGQTILVNGGAFFL